MIKKTVLIAVLIFSAQAVFAQTVKRTAKQPDFFMPQQILDKMYQPEKLPPVEKMQINGKPAPVVEEMRQKAAAEAEKKRLAEVAAKKKAEAEAQKKRAEKIAELNRQKEEAEKRRAELLAKQQQAAQQKRQAEQQLPATKNYSAKSEKPAQPVITQSSAPKPPAPTSDPEISNAYNFSYDDIIAEYKKDAANISKNVPFNNPRLKSVIQDYKNMERKI